MYIRSTSVAKVVYGHASLAHVITCGMRSAEWGTRRRVVERGRGRPRTAEQAQAALGGDWPISLIPDRHARARDFKLTLQRRTNTLAERRGASRRSKRRIRGFRSIASDTCSYPGTESSNRGTSCSNDRARSHALPRNSDDIPPERDLTVLCSPGVARCYQVNVRAFTSRLPSRGAKKSRR